VEQSKNMTDAAAIDRHEITAREEQREIDRAPIKQMWFSPMDAREMPRSGESMGAQVMRESDSRDNAIRYTVRRLMDIEWTDWWQFFSYLNPSDIRYRFGRVVSVEAALRLLTLPNPYGSMIFGAFCPEGLVGVANLAKDEMGRAEIAVLVRSDWKRRGIGEALMRAVLCQATRERLQVYGLIQPSNSAIIGLMRRLGFVYGPRQIDHTIMHWRPAGTQRTTGKLARRANRSEAIEPIEGLCLRTATAEGKWRSSVVTDIGEVPWHATQEAHAAEAEAQPSQPTVLSAIIVVGRDALGYVNGFEDQSLRWGLKAPGHPGA
jgi:GNAT superfamily N-acetyltransferase